MVFLFLATLAIIPQIRFIPISLSGGLAARAKWCSAVSGAAQHIRNSLAGTRDSQTLKANCRSQPIASQHWAPLASIAHLSTEQTN